VDVWSHPPHEGRLDLHNKRATRLTVGQPACARRGKIRCQVGRREVAPEWRGNRLVFEGLRGGERLTVRAPVSTELVELTLVCIADPHYAQLRYEVEFRGHTALIARQIAPPTE
jgi:hypothetical protein